MYVKLQRILIQWPIHSSTHPPPTYPTHESTLYVYFICDLLNTNQQNTY